MAKDPTQGPVSRYDEMNQPVPPEQSIGGLLIDAKHLREELSGRTVPQLKQMAAKLEIPGYSKMRKAKLTQAILKFYGYESARAPISQPPQHPSPSSPHPPMAAGDLGEPEPEGVSARVRRIRETSGQ